MASGVTVVFPLCLIAWIAGDPDCLGITEWLEEENPIRGVRGEIGGLSTDFFENDSVGIWHFINMQPGAVNRWDDKPGWFLDEAGWERVPDGAEQAVAILMDTTAVLLDYDHARGRREYEYNLPKAVSEPDWARFTNEDRDRADWSGNFLPAVVMAPVDNLALDGYLAWYGAETGLLGQQVRNIAPSVGAPLLPRACYLAGPLHALGDASVPHHVVNSSGYGHVPFEAVASDDWRLILSNGATTTEYEQLRDVLQRAFRFWLLIKEYQDANSTTVVPIRELVTAVAQTTYDLLLTRPSEINDVCNADAFSGFGAVAHPAPWPLISCVSVYDKVGAKVGFAGDSPESPYRGQRADYLPHFTVAMGSTVALLTSVMQHVPASGDPGVVACRIDTQKDD